VQARSRAARLGLNGWVWHYPKPMAWAVMGSPRWGVPKRGRVDLFDISGSEDRLIGAEQEILD